MRGVASCMLPACGITLHEEHRLLTPNPTRCCSREPAMIGQERVLARRFRGKLPMGPTPAFRR